MLKSVFVSAALLAAGANEPTMPYSICAFDQNIPQQTEAWDEAYNTAQEQLNRFLTAHDMGFEHVADFCELETNGGSNE